MSQAACGGGASRAVRAYIAFGANLGDPAAAFDHTLTQLNALPATRLAGRSRLYRSAPVDAPGQPDYFNAVIAVDTGLAPLQLLHALQDLERAAGRTRTYRNAPRPLDLDLLLYGETVWQDGELTLPHPRMHQRAFVLRPLAELAPGLHLPGHGDLASLLPAVADQAAAPL
ncbi:2-amino-4-hydroxy-6-hydroxymethyldihydropteridine diphosphokinase [Azoarcus sp. TTM-91]|uniref:2-amino-4-hydroxy-6- hydroxymethyldihydropteridine diphosphokinase n=1 Tax=Azoarcus sp. TTM-91 TaxID=2691581 RepID=UPI00145E7606|nr:2-amino-4-hydroxy-6-hydroxymethyldihydropteridine diphosphokinase [Azoarcus sp. TTM-91]